MAKCPHCEKTVSLDTARRDQRTEVHKESVGVAKKEVMYSCPHCDCVLGFAFFMGGLLSGRP